MLSTTTLSLDGDRVDLWVLFERDLASSALLDRYRALLPLAERQRELQFRMPADRMRFVAARALVRYALSRYTGGAPQAWRFAVNAHGRPQLARAGATRSAIADSLSFNLSHTDGMIVCAVARHVSVGADVECVRRRLAANELAVRFFAPREVIALRGAAAHEQHEQFFCYWTLKESFVKAKGLGLAIPLQQFSFTLPAGADDAVGFESSLGDVPDHWRFWVVRPSADHLAAVAASCVDAGRLRLSVRRCIPLIEDAEIDCAPWVAATSAAA